MRNPLVSVVLPVHNNESTLPRAVDSILKQTFEDFELVIVADGSPAAVLNYLDSLEGNRQIKIIRIGKSGIARALNIGMRYATGGLIARMDADDICDANRLSIQTEFMQNNPDVHVLASRVIYSGDPNSGFARFVDWQNRLITHSQMYEARFQDAVVCHPSVMIRSELLRKHGGYCEKGPLPEDFELWLRFFQNGVIFYKLQTPLLEWTDSPNRLSRTDYAYNELSFWNAKAYYLSKQIGRRKYNCDLYAIGRGRMVNEKIRILSRFGINILKKVDVKNHPGNPGFITFNDLSKLKNSFYISLVRDPDGRERIVEYLKGLGLKHDIDFILME